MKVYRVRTADTGQKPTPLPQSPHPGHPPAIFQHSPDGPQSAGAGSAAPGRDPAPSPIGPAQPPPGGQKEPRQFEARANRVQNPSHSARLLRVRKRSLEPLDGLSQAIIQRTNRLVSEQLDRKSTRLNSSH